MSPRAQYYVVRPGAVTTLPSGGRVQAPARLVPLVAVDQLPEWINIVGVPRELKPEDAATMLAIASNDDGSKVKTRTEDDGGSDNLFEVRIVPRKNKTTPGQTTAASPKVKVEQVEKKVDLASLTSLTSPTSLTPAPKDTTESTAGKKGPAAAEVKDAKEALAFVTAPSTPSGAAVVAPPPTTTTTSPTMLAFGQELLAAQEYLPKDESANGGAPFDSVHDLLAALNQKPLGQHFFDAGVEATKAATDVDSSHGNMLVNDLINFGLTDSQPAIVQLDGQADEGEREKEEEDKGKEEKKVEQPVDATAAAPPDKKEKKETTSLKPGSPKPGSPPKKTVVAKTTWSPQKTRSSSPVKPCRHWCRTGHCDYGTKCYYAHVMPQTPEGLKAVDLDHIPVWWTKKRASKEGDKDDSKNNKVNKAKAAGDGVRGGPRRSDVAAGTARKATSPVPPTPGAPSRNLHSTPRAARSDSSSSTTDSGPYLNQFSHFKTEMATQTAKEQGTYYTALVKAAAPPPPPSSSTRQTRHTRAHSSVAPAATSARAERSPYIGMAMQTSRPSRISWMAGVTATATATGTTINTTTRSRAQSVATSGATKDSGSSDKSVGDNKNNGGSGSGTSLPHMVSQKKLEQEQKDSTSSVSLSSAPPVREADNLLVDL